MSEIRWTEDGEARSARWRSDNGSPPPARVVIADDRLTADTAYRLARQGTALLWRGDFHGARQLLRALARRTERPSHDDAVAGRAGHPPRRAAPSPDRAFHLHRQARSRRARTLGMLLVPLDHDYAVPLRRAPDVRQACSEVYGPASEPSVVSLRELLGVVGAHEWRVKGVDVPALGDRIHPHYGVFSPIRGEYVDLVARAPLALYSRAFDIGTGTGVLA
ncbi:MAG: methyltransferase, partial [Thermoactinospora sp.]|nr:methyltransferase [Thermoactinospora sp.]